MTWRRQAAPHAPLEEARGRLRSMARVKSAVAGESIPTACGVGQTAQHVACVSDMDGGRDLSARGGQQLAHMHPFRGGCLIGQLIQESRGVAAESIKFRDRKGNEADVGATPRPLPIHLELGLLSTASSDFGRRGARNAKQTGK
jgi:hypothetical protein